MKRSLPLILFTTALAALSLAACGNNKKTEPQGSVSSVPQTESVKQERPAGDLYIESIPGTYTGLFDIVCTPEYHDVWIGQIATFVGETDAPSLADQLKSILTSRPAGESETSTVNNGGPIETNGYFICGLDTLTIDGHTISGADENGTQVFSHEYTYVSKLLLAGMMEGYLYETADEDAGEFKYFYMMPDTPATTYHLEFRYGSNVDDLAKYNEGPYAYWLAAGFPVDADEEMIKNVITLFCEENLAEEQAEGAA